MKKNSFRRSERVRGWNRGLRSEFEILEVAILNGDLGPGLKNVNGWIKME